jgi:hypothetical protein
MQNDGRLGVSGARGEVGQLTMGLVGRLLRRLTAQAQDSTSIHHLVAFRLRGSACSSFQGMARAHQQRPPSPDYDCVAHCVPPQVRRMEGGEIDKGAEERHQEGFFASLRMTGE